MIRAALISLALAPAADAQPVACAFTLVCAPEIECEAHDGIPFEIGFQDGVWSIEVDGEVVAGNLIAPPPALGLTFVAGGDRMLFTLTEDGDGALTRHDVGAGGRLTAASFLGPCVMP